MTGRSTGSKRRSHCSTANRSSFSTTRHSRSCGRSIPSGWRRARATAPSSTASAKSAFCSPSSAIAIGRRRCSLAIGPAQSLEDTWHLTDGRIVHVMAEQRPDGGVTYLFADETERIALESRYNASHRRAARDNRQPQGRRRGFRHRRPPEALQQRLLRDLADAGSASSASCRISARLSPPRKRCIPTTTRGSASAAP